jgi:hypothetical protein
VAVLSTERPESEPIPPPPVVPVLSTERPESEPIPPPPPVVAVLSTERPESEPIPPPPPVMPVRTTPRPKPLSTPPRDSAPKLESKPKIEAKRDPMHKVQAPKFELKGPKVPMPARRTPVPKTEATSGREHVRDATESDVPQLRARTEADPPVSTAEDREDQVGDHTELIETAGREKVAGEGFGIANVPGPSQRDLAMLLDKTIDESKPPVRAAGRHSQRDLAVLLDKTIDESRLSAQRDQAVLLDKTIDESKPSARANPEPPRDAKLPISTAPSSLPPPKETGEMSGPTPACPQCEAPMAWVDEHLRFYCKQCRMYF